MALGTFERKVAMGTQGFFSNKNIASFILVFMSIQLCWIEGFQTSIPKTLMMALSPIFILLKSPRFSKAIGLSVLYLGVTIAMYYMQFTGNGMTFLHMALQWSLFCLFYNLVHYENCFTIDDAIKVVKLIVYLYAICLVLQQFLFLAGMRSFHPLNLYNFPYYRLFRLPSLALEPSHAARILTVCGYAYLKLNQFKNGRIFSLHELFYENALFTYSYIYTMLSLGSGTAMVGLALLSLYFIRLQYAIGIIFVLLLAFIFGPSIDYEPLNRVLAVFDAASSMDASEVYKVDQSASARVGVIILTIQNLDLTDANTWLGIGVHPGNVSVVEGIEYYGLISYLLLLLLLFRCCFSKILSLDVLFFIFLLSLGIRNFAYVFAILLIMTMVKHFYEEYRANKRR